MKKILFALMVIVTSVYADTLNDRMADIQGATLAAKLVGTPYKVNDTPSIHIGDIRYWAADGDTVRENTAAIVIVDYNGGSEAAYWLKRIPDVLQPAPEEPEYITDRATPFSAAQIESFCNSIWLNTNPGASEILEFDVVSVDGKTVRVSGKFDVGTDTREGRVYYIQLIDPNGSVVVGNANVKFERVTE